jgi:hypothetical protein
MSIFELFCSPVDSKQLIQENSRGYIPDHEYFMIFGTLLAHKMLFLCNK